MKTSHRNHSLNLRKILKKRKRKISRNKWQKIVGLDGNYEFVKQSSLRMIQEPNSVTLHETALSEVMAYLPPKSLLACRLVDRTWNRAAVPHLRKRGTADFSSINLQLPSSVRILKSGSGDDGLMSNVKLNVSGLNDFTQPATIVLANFLQKYGTTTSNLTLVLRTESVALAIQLLSLLPLLKKVTFIFPTPLDWAFHNEWEYIAYSSIPTLKSIELDLQVDDLAILMTMPTMNNFIKFIDHLLTIAPNLDSLVSKNIPMCQGLFFNGDRVNMLLLNILILNSNCPNLSNLHFKSVAPNFGPRDMLMLLLLELSLKELVLPRFDVPPSKCRDFMVDFINIIDRRRSELQLLEFTIPNVPDRWPQIFLEFSPFPNLSKLTLSINFETKSDVSILVFDKIDYAITFPVLKELTLNIGCAEYGKRKNVFKRRFQILNAFFPIDGQEFKNLQFLTVHLPHPNTILRKSELQLLTISWRISRMFPNVHNNCAINACRRLNMLGNAA